MNIVSRYCIRFLRGNIRPLLTRYTDWYEVRKINICSGGQKVPGYWGIDLDLRSDLIINLAIKNLPFSTGSIECVVCTSGINYFTRSRALALIRETYRVLRPGGVARYSVQDLELLTRRYLEKDWGFFGEKLPNGEDRFKGDTLADKFVAWFYGHPTAGGPCRYMYDFTSLAALFLEAGFQMVEKRGYLESRLEHVRMIDNRPEQMFFIEAIK